MAQHKAPTQVTVAAYQEKSGLATLADRYWKAAALVAVIVTAVILGNQYALDRAQASHAAQWDLVNAAVNMQPSSGLVGGSAAALEEAVSAVKGTNAEAWALLAQVHAYAQERDYEGARRALQELRESGALELTEETLPLGQEGGESTLVDHLDDLLARQAAWETEHAGLFENRPPAEGAPRVRLETSAGNIVVALYADLAPKHVENFLEHCRSGYYDGTKFHRVIPGFMIQGGDPNTKEEDITIWGQGGPDYKIDREENDLYHFRGVLAGAKMGRDTQSSGSQFYITTGSPHHLDGQHVVYGVVIEGMEIAETIEGGEVADPQSNRPVEPVEILKTVEL